MLRVLDCVTQEHEPWLVALAVMVCLAGAFTSMRLLRHGLTSSDVSRQRWIRVAAGGGGGTIWVTHFVAMLAHRSGVPLAFNVTLTFASVAVAIGLTWLGLHIATVSRQPWALLAGGCVVGLGIGAMHYWGMLAIAIPGALIFDPTYVAGSVAVGCVCSAASIWMAARRGDGVHHAAATLLFALAIAGHHFTSLAGTDIALDGRQVDGWAPDGPWLAVAVAVAAITILGCAAASVVEQNLSLRITNGARVHELSVQSTRFQAALDNMTQGLCMFDGQGRLIVHNRRFAAMFGTPAAGATTATLRIDMCLGEMVASPDAARGDGPDGVAHEMPDGRVIQVSRQAMPDAGWVATYEDVTERRRSRDQLSHMARHDALTGLPNRFQFREHMEHAAIRARPGDELAVLYLDLDGFKGVNDTFGHPVGDELLRAVAARLRDCTRETELVARLGGDEFAVVQADVQQPSEAAALSDRLVEALQAPFTLHGHHITIGTSIGIALGASSMLTADGLLRNADIALYRAKAAGRGTWRLFEPEMDAEMQMRHALERDLRQAMAEGQFEVFYQPLIEASTEKLIGFEALLRWNHPERGMVSPADFIPLAEETGLIRAMGAWVLERACADAVGWPKHVKVAVNLSPIQFLKGNLVHEVERALAASGLAPGRLELEITESVLLQDNDTTLGILHQLRGLGARISMDDFGTGYSSLKYLRRFPFDKIKIDQSFVRNLATDRGSIEIVRAVVGLGRALSMEVLAEGVETADQLLKLQAEGCGELQGYFFSPPRPLRDVQDLIARYSINAHGADDTQASLTAGPRLALASSPSR